MKLFKLNDKQKAELHLAFAKSLGAGLTPEQSINGMLDLFPKDFQHKLKIIASSVRKGSSLVNTLYTQEILSPFDYSLLSTGEQSGTQDKMHEYLAKTYETNFLRWQRFRSQMMFPIAVGLIALLVLPIPLIFSGQLTLSAYLFNTCKSLIFIFIIYKLLAFAISYFNNRGWPKFLISFCRIVPSLDKLILNSCRARLLSNFAIMQEAGIPAIESFDIAVDDNVGLSKELSAHARRSLGGSLSVSDALHKAKLLDDREGYAIVSTGENAGKLVSSLNHYATGCQRNMDSSLDFITNWAPKIIYLFIAIAITKGILG